MFLRGPTPQLREYAYVALRVRMRGDSVVLEARRSPSFASIIGALVAGLVGAGAMAFVAAFFIAREMAGWSAVNARLAAITAGLAIGGSAVVVLGSVLVSWQRRVSAANPLLRWNSDTRTLGVPLSDALFQVDSVEQLAIRSEIISLSGKGTDDLLRRTALELHHEGDVHCLAAVFGRGRPLHAFRSAIAKSLGPTHTPARRPAARTTLQETWGT